VYPMIHHAEPSRRRSTRPVLLLGRIAILPATTWDIGSRNRTGARQGFSEGRWESFSWRL